MVTPPEYYKLKITSVKFEQDKWHYVKVHATFEDGTSKIVTGYWPDELHFTESEFVGLTEFEAQELKRRKDVAYLRS